LAVMQHSEHVMLCGEGALEFAINQQVELAPERYFFSDFRYQQWKSIMDTDGFALDHNNAQIEQLMKNKKFGTVGAVACDKLGNVAAATSTGGMTNKRYNRVGDSPIIGAGNYANNATCAISCTGHGEWFMKAVAAYDVSCLMEYKGLTLKDAMATVVHQKLLPMGGEGGMIGVDSKGNIAMDFNSAGMYRAAIDTKGQLQLGIFG
jgi:L-asparaginase / beta-aspartyl-peptidase